MVMLQRQSFSIPDLHHGQGLDHAPARGVILSEASVVPVLLHPVYLGEVEVVVFLV
jgi:hypothetical protein